MFIARERELATLEESYASNSFQMIPVWGRRRVGKTRLLNEFVAGKPRVHFFTAGETTAPENLRRLSAAVQTWYDPLSVEEISSDAPVFPSFEAAFGRVFAEASQERTIFVIDEYPYLAKSYPGISSLVQRLIDANKETSKLMLVLCGSSMSFMEHQVLGEKSPLYGRRTAQLRLEPFDYLDAARLLGTDDPVRACELFSLVGGVPLYLEQLDAGHTTRWNIARRMLGQANLLYAEPRAFLLQEVTSPAPYAAVIEAVAQGRTRPNEVADATGIQGPNVNEYLKRLGELGIVERMVPTGRAKKRQVIYRVSDELFRFWHSFVPRYEVAIEMGRSSDVARRIVERDLSTYVGHEFEVICRQWLIRQMTSGEVDVLPSKIGAWWGNDPGVREQIDVDVVVLGMDGELICGECKWTERPVDVDVLKTLAHRSRLMVDECSSVQLMMFSKSGFTDAVRREADQMENVRLISLGEMFEGV